VMRETIRRDLREWQSLPAAIRRSGAITMDDAATRGDRLARPSRRRAHRQRLCPHPRPRGRQRQRHRHPGIPRGWRRRLEAGVPAPPQRLPPGPRRRQGGRPQSGRWVREVRPGALPAELPCRLDLRPQTRQKTRAQRWENPVHYAGSADDEVLLKVLRTARRVAAVGRVGLQFRGEREWE
jgi:hypothetical protein